MKFELNFFLSRLRITKEVFFKGVMTVEDALLLMEENDIVSYDHGEVKEIVDNNVAMAAQLEKTKSPKKTVSRRKKTSSNSVRKTTRTRKKTSRSKKSNGSETESKEDEKKDSSYFKTWKVPYVEPE